MFCWHPNPRRDMSAGAHIKHALCAFSSAIFGFLYLNVLFFLALCKNLGVTKQTPLERLPKPERKLTFNLAYYMHLEGFGLQHHSVTTSDGFILQIDRLVPPGERTPQPGTPPVNPPRAGTGTANSPTGGTFRPRYPVLLIPGLMQSSSGYCTAGPQAIALVLSRAGYDVWLGNNRGGFRPQHKEYGACSAKMWDWSMAELATRDVPAMVEYVKKQTGADKIAVGAHSQGTTQTFLALSTEEHGGVPNLGASISSFSALAPAVYAGPLVDRWFLRLLRVGHSAYHAMLGFHAFIGLMGDMRGLLPLGFFTYTAYIVFNYMLGWNDTLWDARYRSRNFIFAPVFVSSLLMFWWLGRGGFADRRCIFEREDTKWFDERFPPCELYACGRDNLVLPDVLINRIQNHEPDVKDRYRVVHLPTYSHLDVLWAMDASETVATPMADFIWKNVVDKERWRMPELSGETAIESE